MMDLEKVKKIEEFVRLILNGMGLEHARIEAKARFYPKILIHIEAKEDDNLLIGYHGETLKALQYIINLYANRKLEDQFIITVDVGEYRKRQYKRIKHLALEKAKEAKKSGNQVALPPMNAYERRIVHKVISENFNDVITQSMGDEGKRYIVILPVKENER